MKMKKPIVNGYIGDFLKQLAAKLELVLLIPISGEANPVHWSLHQC